MRESSAIQKSFLFTTFFGAVYALTFIFSEQFAFLWIAPAFVVLYGWSFWKMFDAKHTPIRKQNVLLAVVLSGILTLLLLLTPVSVLIPSSILRWSSLAFVGLTVFFFSVSPIIQKIKLSQFLSVIVTIHALLLCLQAVLLLFPAARSSLPEMSVLGFTGGHNHAYILYLISFPIAMYLHKQEKQLRWSILAALFVIGVILSLSRVGMALIGLELLVFGLWFNGKLSKITRLLLLGTGSVLAVFFILFFVFTLQPQFSFGNNCRVPLLQDQLCKSFSADRRLTYWANAVQGILERPVLGHGGNTFQSVSLRYRPTTNAFSMYPHNEYLQLILEYGVVGVVVVCLYLGSLVYGLRKWAKLTIFTKLLLTISVVLAIDAFFNFNWNFTGLLLAEMLIFSFYLSSVMQDVLTKTHLYPLRRVMLPFATIAVPLSVISLLFISSQTVQSHRPLWATALFPFQQQLAIQRILDPSTPDSQLQLIERLYANDATLLKLWADQEVDPQKKFALYVNLEQLDPQNERIRLQVLELAVATSNSQKVLETLDWLDTHYGFSRSYALRQISPHYFERVIIYSNQLSETDPEKASQIAAKAYRIEPWTANEVQTFFLLNPDQYTDEQVLRVLEVQSPYTLWSYYTQLNAWTWQKMRLSGEEERWSDFHSYTKAILLYTDWEPQVVWNFQSDLFRMKLENIPASQVADQKRQELLRSWRESLESIRKFGKVGETLVDTTGWERVFNEFHEE